MIKLCQFLVSFNVCILARKIIILYCCLIIIFLRIWNCSLHFSNFSYVQELMVLSNFVQFPRTKLLNTNQVCRINLFRAFQLCSGVQAKALFNIGCRVSYQKWLTLFKHNLECWQFQIVSAYPLTHLNVIFCKCHSLN